MNIVMLRGNVGQDPEIRSTQGGASVCNLRLAVTERYVDKEGNQQERTDWITVVAWSGLADLCRDRVTKGTELFVRGELRARSWEQNGAKRTVLEVNAAEIAVIAGRARDQRGSTGRDDRRGGSTGRDDERQQSQRGGGGGDNW